MPVNQDESLLHIEVVFATPAKQTIVELNVPAGTTIVDAISQSGLRDKFGEDIPEDSPFGIWGSVVEPGRLLEDGDRVEIYRDLELDPREARRLLAQQGRTMNQGIVTDESER